MKTDRIPITLKQCLVILLIIINVLMLFMPWIELRVEVSARDYYVDDVVEALRRKYYIDIYDVTYIAEHLADDIHAENESKAIKHLAKRLDAILDSIQDSRLSPCELAVSISSISSIVRYAFKEYKYYAYDNHYYYTDTIAELQSNSISLILVSTLVWIFIIAIALNAISAIKRTLRGDITSTAPFIVLYFVYFAVLVIIVVLCNQAIEASWDEYEILFLIFEEGNTDLLHLTATPFIGAVLALASALINKYMPAYLGVEDSLIDAGGRLSTGISDTFGKIKDGVGASSLMGWECSCGKLNSGSAEYCANCGQKKVDYSKCENCGATLHRGSSFCSTCGAPVTRKPPACPNCGKAVKSGMKYCVNCGQKLDYALETASAGRSESFKTPDYTGASGRYDRIGSSTGQLKNTMKRADRR